MENPDTSPAPAEPGSAFHPFTVEHALVVAVFLVALGAAVVLGRRGRGPRVVAAERAVGVGGLVLWAVSTAYWLLPANYDVEKSLPIQMCDFAALIAPLALLTGYRPFRSITYFWGLGLSSQSFVTPTLERGYASPA